MRRGMCEASIEIDEEYKERIWDYLESRMDRGKGKAKDRKLVADAIGANIGAWRKRCQDHTDFTIGEILELQRAGFIPAEIINDMIHRLGGGHGEVIDKPRRVFLRYVRQRHVIEAVDLSGRVIGWARTQRSLSDRVIKWLRAICAWTCASIDIERESGTNPEAEDD